MKESGEIFPNVEVLDVPQTVNIQELQGVVEGLSDFELENRPRTRPVSYTLTLPPGCGPEQPAKGLLFYIPGFGEDNSAEYIAKIRSYVAESFGLAAVSVDYHAIHARPVQGCSLTLDTESEEKLLLLFKQFEVPFDEEDVTRTIQLLGQKIPRQTELKLTINPPDDEYQNFGVLQALDHLSVLNDLVSEEIPLDWNNVIAVGSSHGAYIAHLMCKFAPNSINAVIDNSSYTRAPLSYLGLFTEYSFPVGNIILKCSVKTPWQFRIRASANYYGLPQQLIRETAFPPHLEEMKRNSERLPQYFCFNSVQDFMISPIEEKRLQRDHFQALGFEYHLQEITEADIDGKLFKTMDHGMNTSMKSLCQLVLPKIHSRPTTLDRFLKTVLEYDGYDRKYSIRHLDVAPWIQASVIAR